MRRAHRRARDVGRTSFFSNHRAARRERVMELSMQHSTKLSAISAALLVALATAASAHDYTVGSLKINHPWSRATPKGASVAGGYMTITNTGTTPDRLTGGSTEAARTFEIHEMSMGGGVMKMRELPNGIEIPPGATVELKPGAYHVMMTGIAKPFVKGERVKASLNFEKAGKLEVEFTVDAAGAKTTEHKH
jgi:copper(I)-binding protein